MSFAVRIEPVEPAAGALPAVDYRWDADTDILTASVRPAGVSEGLSGSVEIVGDDGSWLVLDVAGGRIAGIEVAVWPPVRTVASLTPPADAHDALVLVPARRPAGGLAAVEVNAPLAAEADAAERTIHFRLGSRRRARALRIARDLVLDLDDRDHVAGLWLLNVPPFPADAATLAPSENAAPRTPDPSLSSSPRTPEQRPL
jgi:hypothetical protein